MIDVPRLRKELEFVTANRDLWEQGCWIGRAECGTVACLAGWTVLHAGYGPYERNLAFVRLPVDDPLRSRVRVIPTSTSDAGLANVDDVARELLGLTGYQAVWLFHPLNDLAELWRAAAAMTDGEVEVPPEFVGTTPDR
jgi:hypothetical protein